MEICNPNDVSIILKLVPLKGGLGDFDIGQFFI